MLQNQIEGKIDSWAIRWDASMLINGKYCLHPTIPLVKNIGFDGSGVHCDINDIDQPTTDNIAVREIPLEDSKWFYDQYRIKFGSIPPTPSLTIRMKMLALRIKNKLYRLL